MIRRYSQTNLHLPALSKARVSMMKCGAMKEARLTYVSFTLWPVEARRDYPARLTGRQGRRKRACGHQPGEAVKAN